MSNTISTWSPLDLILPTVDANSDYAFYFVTDSGSIEGLNINFNAGDWLVYLKKDGVANWYKTSGGITVFNQSTAVNAPDPGYYTKVRLDNNGQIIDASYIDSDDLPKHTHNISEITGDLDLRIQSVVGAMFQQHNDSSVKFDYDSSTHTITAEVNIDDDTITRDEFGELVASGSGSGSGGTASEFTGKVTIEQVEDLSDRLLAIESQIQKNFVVCKSDSGLKANYKDEATYLSVRFDGTSLVLNSDGELSVSPSLITGGGATDGSTTSCGSHIHTVSQITDFEEAVKALVQSNAKFNVTEIPLDSSTIIVNSNGELSCIAAGTKPHTHTMSDISDLPDFVDIPAPEQVLVNELSLGYSNLTGKTIEEAISILNSAIKDISEKVENVSTLVNKANPPEPDKISDISISKTYLNKKQVLNILTKNSTEAGSGITLTTEYFYPANKGTLRFYVDGDVVYEKTLDDTTGSFIGTTFIKYYDENFSVLDIRDSYVGVSIYTGFYKSQKVQYVISNLEEGFHTAYIEHIVDDAVYKSSEVNFNTYETQEPSIILSGLTLPKNNTYISGIPCYNGNGEITFTPVIDRAYKTYFMTDSPFSYIFNGESEVFITPESFINGRAIYPKQTVYITSGKSGQSYITGKAYDVTGTFYTSTYNFNALLWNSTDIENYRYQYTKDYGSFGTQIPSRLTAVAFEKYKSTNAIQSYEMAIFNNIGKFVGTNYESYGGPNYSTNRTDNGGYVWANFRIPCSTYLSNIHFEAAHGDGTAYSRAMNGTLEGFQIYFSISSTDTPSVWVNGNAPYIGYGSANGLDYSGLDLFRSTDTERYVTWGQRPDIDTGYLYIKVGTKSNIDLGKLLSSIKESIDEWA